MSLRLGWEPPKVHMSIVSGQGGLGDNIARLPAYICMLETYRHVSATIYVQDYVIDLVRYLLPEGPRLKYEKMSEARWEMRHPIVEFLSDRIGSLHLNLTTQAFLMLMDQLPPSQEAMAYPRAELYVGAALNLIMEDVGLATKPYVVFTTDYTALARQWPACHINTLARRLRASGLVPVLLGTTEELKTGVPNDDIKPKANDGLKTELFVDLRNKTTLVEALGVMQRAKAVVGLDNGLLHLAHCTDTPVVVGFTTLKPEHRVPVRQSDDSAFWSTDPARGAELTKVLEAEVPCAGCQSRGFAINTDWRECVMTEHRYACTLTLTADRFWSKLVELGVV